MTIRLVLDDHSVKILVFCVNLKFIWSLPPQILTCEVNWLFARLWKTNYEKLKTLYLILGFVMLQAGGGTAWRTANGSQAGAAGVGAAVGRSSALPEWTDAQQLAAQQPLPTPHGQCM